MSAKILEGSIIAEDIRKELKKEIGLLKSKSGKVPVIANIMIGKNNSSAAYANSQKNVAESIGIDYKLVSLDENSIQKDVVLRIDELNKDKNINGIMIYKPVPSQIDYADASRCIDEKKDVEGINASNSGKIILGENAIIPSTPAAVMTLLRSTDIDLDGKEVVVVGHSEIVGKPLSLLLMDKLATVTVCHIGTSKAGKLAEHVGRADILIVAVGKPGLIKGDWVKQGAIVIDVGINHVGKKIVGDVEFDEAKKHASFITPVPGGVGPITVMMLMRNAIEIFKKQNN